MDVQAHIVLPTQDALTGMDPDPHAELTTNRPIVRHQAQMNLNRRRHCVGRSAKDTEICVALRVDHSAIPPTDGGLDDPRMFRQTLCLPFTQGAQEPGRAFNIGEQERNRPRWQLHQSSPVSGDSTNTIRGTPEQPPTRSF